MIPKRGRPILWEELTWKDADRLTRRMKMAIMPTAACEQHGPHLPLAVDTIDCYEVAKRVSARTGVPVVPPLIYGCSEPRRFSRHAFHKARHHDEDDLRDS